jgi:tetratricopeptide (TPR) repeat protein
VEVDVQIDQSVEAGRSESGRWRALARPTVLAALLTAGALVLSACGGPSSAQTARQDLYSGIAAQKAGNYGIASADYQKVLALYPKDVYALYDLGDVEQFQHLYAAAKTHYQDVLALSPKFQNALYNLAILDARSNPSEAKALYEEVIALSPRDAVAHLNLGKVLLRMGETGAGNAQVRLAVTLDPSLRSVAPSS